MTPFKKYPRAAVWLFVLLAVSLAAWAAWTYALLPKHVSTVSLLHAADTFHQCSREAPVPDGDYWMPTSAQIRQVEAALPRMMTRRAALGQQLPRKLDLSRGEYYQHQYIGFTLHGERLIYLDAAQHIPEMDADDSFFEKMGRWLPERPANVCDGGSYFWGVVYRPATAQFETPQFNGVA